MTLTEQVKILDGKIKANKVQYELHREAVNISALSTDELEKYEYLTGEDLGYKPDVIQKAKFEYSALGKVCNKGLNESYKKEGLLEILKNIEDKEQPKDEKDDQLTITAASDIIDKRLSPEARNLIAKLSDLGKTIKYNWLNLKVSNSRDFDFRDYPSLKEFFEAIYYINLSPEDAEGKQDEFNGILGVLDKYAPRKSESLAAKNDILINAKNLFDGREMILNAFKNKIFPFEEEEEEDTGYESRRVDDREYIDDVSDRIDNKLFRKYFKYKDLLGMYDELSKTKNTERNKIQVNVIKNGLVKLNNSINNLSDDDETKDELGKITDTVNEVLELNKGNQEGQGFKTLTPEQMLSGIRISLAQLNTGNNSEKLKNEIRQLLYYLYR